MSNPARAPESRSPFVTHRRAPIPPLCADVPGRPNPLAAAVTRVIAVPNGVVEPSGGDGLGEKLTHGLILRALEALEAVLGAQERAIKGRLVDRYLACLVRDLLGKQTMLDFDAAVKLGDRFYKAMKTLRAEDANRDAAQRAAARAEPYPPIGKSKLPWDEPQAPAPAEAQQEAPPPASAEGPAEGEPEPEPEPEPPTREAQTQTVFNKEDGFFDIKLLVEMSENSEAWARRCEALAMEKTDKIWQQQKEIIKMADELYQLKKWPRSPSRESD